MSRKRAISAQLIPKEILMERRENEIISVVTMITKMTVKNAVRAVDRVAREVEIVSLFSLNILEPKTAKGKIEPKIEHKVAKIKEIQVKEQPELKKDDSLLSLYRTYILRALY